MKNYKYVIFNKDIIISPAGEILYHENILYEIESMSEIHGGFGLIKTKNPRGTKIFDKHTKLLTISDIRRMKLEIIKEKI